MQAKGSTIIPPPVNLPDTSKDTRKKDKKSKDWEQDGKAKKPKMNAYKKTGKNTRFFEDDDFEDDDLDLFSYRQNDEDEDELIDEDED